MKCLSSCMACICGAKDSNRVGPSDSAEVIQTGGTPEKGQLRIVSVEDERDGGRSNPNFVMGDDGETTSVGNCSSTFSAKAMYIEVGKDRILRVLHIPSIDDEDLESPTGSAKSVEQKQVDEKEKNEGSVDAGDEDTAGGDDEEDEYWFSKWARKPRFRSIFAKNPDSRPKISSENNNNSVNTEENSKLSAELEMKRAAAAAKRRAWAYNNNGNCESTITQQPSINTSDEEEFSSIAIVNSSKQQWSKNGGGSGNQEKSSNPFEQESPEKQQTGKNPFEENSPEEAKAGYNPFDATSPNSSNTSSSFQVHVSVTEQQSNCIRKSKEGISNPAFQDDEEGDDDPSQGQGASPDNKTDFEEDGRRPGLRTLSNNTGSTASMKSASSSNQDDVDAITPEVSPDEGKQGKLSTPNPPVNGYTINVTHKKPLLFFIHSVAGSSDVWHQQMDFFRQLGYEIVAPDLLGHGLSTTPQNPKYYMFESLVQDLILIFDHFAKEDVKVVLVGHGYGASLAAMLTRVRLKNVALFISIAGGGPTPLVRRTCCQDSWLSWKCKLFHHNRVRGRFDDPELRHVLPPLIHENILLGQVWSDGDSAFYRRVTVPTLLVYGMKDKVVTLVEECEMERSIPKSFLELIENAGHQIMQEEPEKLNKMLYKFISSWS